MLYSDPRPYRKLKPTAEGCYDPVEVSAYLGPSARSCAKDWENTGNPANDFERDPPQFKSSAVLYKLLKEYGVEEKAQRARFHTFFFATPDLRYKRPIDPEAKLHITHVLPTKFLRDLVLNLYCSLSDEELEEWCRKFRSHPQICGVMYEVFALQKGWIVQHDATCYFKNDARFTLSSGLALSHGELSADTPLKTLWVAPAAYPAIDGVAVTAWEGKKCFTFLQMTIAKAHDIKQEGITKLWAKFDNLDDFEWRFVFVVPSEEIGKRLWNRTLSNLRHYHKRVPTPGSRLVPPTPRAIPVGYMVAEFLSEDDRKEFVKVSFFSLYQRISFSIKSLGIYLGRR